MKYLILSLLFVGCSNLPTNSNDTKSVSKQDPAYKVLNRALNGATVKDTEQCESAVDYVIQAILDHRDVQTVINIIPQTCVER